MSKKISDSLRSFSDLDPQQFSDSPSRSSRLSDELVNQRPRQTTADSAEDQQSVKFGKMAAQLAAVDADIRRAERVIPELEARGDVETAKHTSIYLEQLLAERQEIQGVMEGIVSRLDNPILIQTKPTKPQSETPLDLDDPYRWAGGDIGKIRAELRQIKGWPGAASRLNRHYGNSLGGSETPAELVLTELAHEIQRGMRPVTPAMWSEFYDRYDPDGTERPPSKSRSARKTTSEREKPKSDNSYHSQRSRYFDPDDVGAEEREFAITPPEEWSHVTWRGDLRSHRETSYDNDDILDGRDNMRSSGEIGSGASPETGNDSRDPMRHIDSELSDDLRDMLEGRRGDESQRQILDENDTEAFYGAPASPLHAEQADSPGREQHMSRAERQASIENDYQFEIAGTTFRNGEIVDYTEADGDKVRHMVIQKTGNNPAHLKLLNLATGTEFAIDESSISRIERLQDPDEEDNPGERENNPGERENNPGEREDIPRERINLIDDIPNIPTPQDILALAAGARLNVDAQIQAVAQAKEQREKLFGRNERDQALLDQANQGLESAYGQYMDNWAAVLADYRGVEGAINDYKTRMQDDVEYYDTRIARLESRTDLTPERRQQLIDTYTERLEASREAIRECDQRIEILHRGVEEVSRRVEVEMMLEMAQTRSKIEAAQCALKVGTKSEKFRTFWRSKNGRRARLAVGAALGITGAMIAMTGVGAGVGSAMVAGAGAVMRGTGGFMATEAGWNMLHNRRADKADLRRRQNKWDAQTASTQVEAGRDMGYMSEHAGDLGAGRMSEGELAAFLEANAGALYSDRILRGALAGSTESSAAVASVLLSSQSERINSDAQSNRRAKRGAAVVGVAAAAAPFVLRHFMSKPPGAPKPTPPDAPRPPAPTPPEAPVPPDAPPVPPVGPGHPELLGVDGRYPWTHMTETLGQNGTPRIMEMAQKAPQYGWHIIGEGGGGSGKVLKVIAPDGFEYIGNANINAALDHLNGLIR